MEELPADISFFMATVESGLNDTDGYKKTWSQSVTRSTIERPSHCPVCRNEQRRKPHADVDIKHHNTIGMKTDSN